MLYEPLILESVVEADDITAKISENFDYAFSGKTSFEVPDLEIDQPFSIGLIVGASGTGKSTLLKQFGQEAVCAWESDKAICSHFTTAEEAQQRLNAVGFNSVPSWFKPYHVLSTGERYRADLARRLESNTVIDEFTSVVDRNVAKSTAKSIGKYIRDNQLTNIVFASCHYDIAEWLEPDWIYDTSKQQFIPRGSLRRPQITLELLPCGYEAWATFSHHHYLTDDLNRSAKYWLCFWGSTAVGFGSAIAYPSGTVQNAYRGHRTVVLPDYQGLGFGVRISDAIGQIHIEQGKRYFSKTTHPRMGEYRNNSPLWKPTSKNMIKRNDSKGRGRWAIREVFSYSHEYIGV